MLTTIERLEQEIDKFHETIASSSELLDLMKSLAEAVNKQTESNKKISINFEKTITKVPESIKSDYDKMLESFILEKNNYIIKLDTAREDFSNNVSKVLHDLSLIPESIVKANEVVIEKASGVLSNLHIQQVNRIAKITDEFKENMNSFSKQLADSKKSFSETDAEINKKYNDFISKLEGINVDILLNICQEILSKQDLFNKQNVEAHNDISTKMVDYFSNCIDRESQKLKKYINDKLLLLYGGIGLIILLLVASLTFLK